MCNIIVYSSVSLWRHVPEAFVAWTLGLRIHRDLRIPSTTLFHSECLKQVYSWQQYSFIWSVIILIPAFRFGQDYGNSCKVPKCDLHVHIFWSVYCELYSLWILNFEKSSFSCEVTVWYLQFYYTKHHLLLLCAPPTPVLFRRNDF